MDLIRFDFKLNEVYYQEVMDFFYKERANIDDYSDRLKVVLNNKIYELYLTINETAKDSLFLVMNFLIDGELDYDAHYVIRKPKDLFKVNKVCLSNKEECLVSIDTNKVSMDRCYEYYEYMYSHILSNSNYLEPLLIQLSLSDKIERFLFIIACYVSKLNHNHIGKNGEFEEFVLSKLEFNGYDVDFANKCEFNLNADNSEKIFEQHIVLLMFIANNQALDCLYYENHKEIYQDYLLALSKEKYFNN